MKFPSYGKRLLALFLLCLPFCGTLPAHAQTAARGSILGTVTDSSGAVIPGAAVTLRRTAGALTLAATTSSSGAFKFSNLPFGAYRIVIRARDFAIAQQPVTVASILPQTLTIPLKVAAATQTVNVQATGPLTTPTSLQTSVSRETFSKIPLESSTSAISSLVTLTTPGVTADSNGMIHGMGDHAENTYSLDGEPITDQMSKTFSNQLPSSAIQSVKVISGAPPAQYGDKTSLVIKVTTRSGEGVTSPTGSIHSSYGAFGTATSGFDVSYGGAKWGNFVELDGLNSGRFLDAPEFSVFHDMGNQENIFDRVDFQFDPKDSLRLDLNYSHSWFQTPNTYDNLNVQNVVSGGATSNPIIGNVGNADQRAKIGTIDVAPTYTRLINNNAVLTFGVFVRRNSFGYYPSNNPLADLGPANLQQESIAQQRSLLNVGADTSLTWTHGVNTVLAGAQYNSAFLNEHFHLGIVSNLLNAPCMDTSGNPIDGYSSPANCPTGTLTNPNYNSALAPYDLTRNGRLYTFNGHADVKTLGLYAEDQIKAGPWFANIGMRGDLYNGLSSASQAEPRVNVAYTIPHSGTVLRVSYARTLETPYNENLVLSSEGCADPVLSPLLGCSSNFTTPLRAGPRDETHAGFEQHIGRHVNVSADYVWKYTQFGGDFSVLGDTPITFPISWQKSKITGIAGRIDITHFRRLLAYTAFSSVAARFFPPQVAGAGATVGQSGYPFRIDHDEQFNQTTHIQYSLPLPTAPWIGFNWRFDSGLVASAAPCYNPVSHDANSACANSSTTLNGQPAIALVDNNLPPATNPVTGAPVYVPLTTDQEMQAGLECAGVKPSPGHPLPAVCPANELTSSVISIPAPGTGDNDHNPPRVQPRSLFDLSIGDNNLFAHGKRRWSIVLSGVNISNKYALYNFLSTFSGTHYVTPRALTAKIAFHF
jgi:outer membrane receptor protein involved in Fe transport